MPVVGEGEQSAGRGGRVLLCLALTLALMLGLGVGTRSRGQDSSISPGLPMSADLPFTGQMEKTYGSPSGGSGGMVEIPARNPPGSVTGHRGSTPARKGDNLSV